MSDYVMKKSLLLFLSILSLVGCNSKPESIQDTNIKIKGTWKLVYGEIQEKDTVIVKDVARSEFIKIINESHFAFFNQVPGSNEGFYGGAGSYRLNGNDYTETLNYIGNETLRNHEFSFKVERKGDSLIQTGFEEVKEAGISRFIIEKYVRVVKPND